MFAAACGLAAAAVLLSLVSTALAAVDLSRSIFAVRAFFPPYEAKTSIRFNVTWTPNPAVERFIIYPCFRKTYADQSVTIPGDPNFAPKCWPSVANIPGIRGYKEFQLEDMPIGWYTFYASNAAINLLYGASVFLFADTLTNCAPSPVGCYARVMYDTLRVPLPAYPYFQLPPFAIGINVDRARTGDVASGSDLIEIFDLTTNTGPVNYAPISTVVNPGGTTSASTSGSTSGSATDSSSSSSSSASTTTSSSASAATTVGVAAGAAGGATLLVLLVGFAVWYLVSRKRARGSRRVSAAGGVLLGSDGSSGLLTTSALASAGRSPLAPSAGRKGSDGGGRKGSDGSLLPVSSVGRTPAGRAAALASGDLPIADRSLCMRCMRPGAGCASEAAAFDASCVVCRAPLAINRRFWPVSRVGGGEFGTAFIAVDLHSPSRKLCVVKKFTFLDHSSNEEHIEKAAQLFLEEGRTLEALDHPCIPKLLGSFRWLDDLYNVMNLVNGKDLQKIARERSGAFSESEVMRLLDDVTDALGYVHARRILHRDVKPSNIIASDDGTYYLVDFGLSTTSRPDWEQATMIGTYAYADPEQRRGYPTASSDLYSLAATCVELLTRARPTYEYFCDWTPPAQPTISPVLAATLARMLRKDPSQRFESAPAVRDVLFGGRPARVRRASNSIGGLANSSSVGSQPGTSAQPIVRRGPSLNSIAEGPPPSSPSPPPPPPPDAHSDILSTYVLPPGRPLVDIN